MSINTFLRVTSAYLIFDAVLVSFFPQFLDEVYGANTAHLNATLANPIGNFMARFCTYYVFALATICGYAATFGTPKDKVKVCRGLTMAFGGLWYHFLIELTDGKLGMMDSPKHEWIAFILSSVFLAGALFFSFSNGGASEPVAKGKKGK